MADVAASVALTDSDWSDLKGIIRDSVTVVDADPAKRFATAALADPERCGRVLLALIKERGIGREPVHPQATVAQLHRGPVPVRDAPQA